MSRANERPRADTRWRGPLLLRRGLPLLILLLCPGCREPSKPRPGSGELSWFLVEQIERCGGRVTLAAPPVAITTNWSYKVYRNRVEVELPSENFYDAWRFLRQLYGAPVSVLEDAKGQRSGSFKDTLSGLTVDLRQSTNCAVIHFRKIGS